MSSFNTMGVMGALAALALAATTAEAKGGSFKVPQVKPDKDGWEVYAAPVVVDKRSAAKLRPGNGSPEAAVVLFYASRIRGDGAWKQALPPRWEQTLKGRRLRRLKRKLAKMADWKYLEVKLLKRKPTEPGKYWIKVWINVEIKGKRDGGTDEAGVERIDGKWYLTSPPT